MNNLMHFYIPEKKFSSPKKANIPKKFSSNRPILRSNRWLLLLWIWPGKLTNFHQISHKNNHFKIDVLRKKLQSTSGWFQILQQTAKAFRGLAMLRCPNKSSVKVAYNLRWSGDILTKSTCSNLGGKFCRRTRWLLRCTKPYNEFITCFHESWIYET